MLATSLATCRPAACCLAVTKRLRRDLCVMSASKAEVGIVGGGLAGTACAGALAERGFGCHIFDMGFSGPGGRSSTRKRDDFQYDHGCQYVAVPDTLKPLFADLQRAGAATEWKGNFGTLDAASGKLSAARSQPDDFCDFGNASMFIGTPGMSSLCSHLSKSESITTHWACKVSAIERREGKWAVKASPKAGPEAGQTLTTDNLDFVVLADIMVTQQESPGGIDLGPAADSPMLQRIKGISKQPVFALMATYDTATEPFDAAQIVNSPNLKLISCNSAKPGRQCPPGHTSWVALSTSEWASDFLRSTAEEAGKQLPAKELTGRAQSQLVQELELIMHKAGWPSNAKPVHLETQRWGSAFKGEVISDACLWDAELWVGMCGDFCKLSSAAGAISSGLAMAEQVSQELHAA